MWVNTTVFLTFCIALWTVHLSAQELTPAQQTAKERGILLFNQYRIGGPYLRIAAEAGDADSQYYLGEEIRTLNRFITRESQKWLEAAANQDQIYAMIRLGRSGNDLCAVMGNCPQGSKTPVEWLKHAHRTALPLAEQGDSEAMFLMYEITLDSDWLTKAAEAGHALAQ
ncbi:hypothetical protein [Halopseudomonas bauzanensis]|uniref:hypothetical protein n=1 Tax=Halopseudomonas bauzanensis TaxID=653930 RepID=UPI0025546EA9|nr:hypothetical protein [Halopseudomonas bauzanensis]